ncbi:hypothetical protein GCM10027612_88020 [Microbispora bryophytorum subsp. camponoti]
MPAVVAAFEHDAAGGDATQAQRDDEAAVRGELVQPRAWGLPRADRGDDPVVRCPIGVAERAIGEMDGDVADARGGQVVAGAATRSSSTSIVVTCPSGPTIVAMRAAL